MEFDPLSRDQAPPRYELESASEDEGDYASLKQVVTHPAIEIKGAIAPTEGSEVIILIQQAGLACLDKKAIPNEHSAVVIDQQQQASISETIGDKTIVYISPTQQRLSQSRFHELAQLLLDHLSPSSVVIVDSYSPAETVFQSDEHDQLGKLRYLADPSFPSNRINASSMVPLTSPESVSGLGAAFLTAAVMRSVPALLALLEEAQFQSHIQLYGSAGEGNVRVSPQSAQAIRRLISPPFTSPSTGTGPSITAFAKGSGRSHPSSNLALGDGNMYI